MANVGYRIMDFLGWSGSDYDWIQAELDRDKEEEEMQKREREEERQVEWISWVCCVVRRCSECGSHQTPHGCVRAW